MNNIDQLLNDLKYFTKNRRFKDCLRTLDELQAAMKAEETEETSNE
jgi:hypothetical protein